MTCGVTWGQSGGKNTQKRTKKQTKTSASVAVFAVRCQEATHKQRKTHLRLGGCVFFLFSFNILPPFSWIDSFKLSLCFTNFPPSKLWNSFGSCPHSKNSPGVFFPPLHPPVKEVFMGIKQKWSHLPYYLFAEICFKMFFPVSPPSSQPSRGIFILQLPLDAVNLW